MRIAFNRRTLFGLLLWLATAGRADADMLLQLNATPAGPVFEGVGAVSGGGATSVLLKDYPDPQRGQILDLLFKPMFAASMQTLYVEVGSDGNATQGTEPTHMRSPKDENYYRGYEWWLMREAKSRNPEITFDACAWGAPGWVGGGEFWSQDMADYYVKWINGAKAVHGLQLSAIGCRNERGDVLFWPKIFRKTLDDAGLKNVRIHAFDNAGNAKQWDWLAAMERDPELAASVDILGNHVLTGPPPTEATLATMKRLGKPVWNTEEHPYNGDGREYKDDYALAIGIVHLFNENYIKAGATKVVNWYLVGSTYPIEPYSAQPPAMTANSPWSGHYGLKPSIWAYAHYGQFTKIGWQYVPAGCRMLDGGGSVVTMKSKQGDYSLIVETSGAKGPQTLTFKPADGFKSGQSLCVWRTTRDAQFIRQDDLKPSAGEAFTVTLEPDAIYSISTTTGQQKGSFDIPEATPFPLPYRDDFEAYGDAKQWGYLPHYTADICGVFEVVDRADKSGKCLKQVVEKKVQSWAPEWMPYTIFGDAGWTDYDVSADIMLPNGGWAGVMTHITETGNGWDGNPAGYFVRLYADGGVQLYAADPKVRGSRQRQLAVGSVKNWKWGRWHIVKLRVQGKTLTALVDGQSIISTELPEAGHGMAGLVCAGEDDARHTALFDNVTVEPVGQTTPVTTSDLKRTPIYP